MKSPKSNLLIVGCGGVAFHSISALAALGEGLGYGTSFAVDPDKIEEKNLSRQWCNAEVGDYKALLLDHNVSVRRKIEEVGKSQWDAFTRCDNLIVFCWCDNDEARLYLAQKLREYAPKVERIIAVTGANETQTACAYGFYASKGEVHMDWTSRMEGAVAEGVEGCGAQTVLANQVASTLSFMQYQYLKTWAPGDTVKDFYWDQVADKVWAEKHKERK